MRLSKRLTALIASVAITATAIFAPISVNATFYERTGVPATKNNYYYSTDYNPFYTSNLWSYCTWYAYGRAWEILGTEPKLSHAAASEWFSYNKQKGAYPYSNNFYEAKLGAIMCFKNHVSIVESVNTDGSPRLMSCSGCSNYTTGQFNVEKWPASHGFYFGAPWDTENFVGYIYITDNGQVNPSAGTETGYVTSTNGLNIRSGPSTNDSVVGSLPYNATVAIFPNKSTGGWYYIKYGSVTGYVTGKYISVVQ